ncbi:MAG: glycosyltransferase family 2 protein [Ignavibacteria bacterium]|nr:glycosyltransferase family 2 protein [Ignavibacteria bacterium]
MKITSVTIAKNESQNIERCINSLKGVVDEIIVLIDSSTTDNTLELVQRHPEVRYELVQWMGFSRTKEYGVSIASYEWIFWIDADEAVSAELGAEIQGLKARDVSTIAAFSMPRKAWFIGRWITHSGWYPGRINRILHKSSFSFIHNEVHESTTINGRIELLQADLLHYTDRNIAHYYDKFNNYTSLAAIDLAKKGRHASTKDLLIRPAFLFLKMYILKRGFLDGLQGFMLAVFSANYVFTKYAKLWEKEHVSDKDSENYH